MAKISTLVLFYTVLALLALQDFREKKISDWHHVGILLLAVISVFTISEISLVMRVAGMFVVSVPMAVLALIIPGSFGGGDVKLVFACGAFLGWKILLKGVVLAIFMAGCCSLWLLLAKRKEKNVQFALGPFLSAGVILSSFVLF